MAQSDNDLIIKAATYGTMSGIRSMSAPAFFSYAASRAKGGKLEGTPFAKLADPMVANGIALASMGEAAVDKLPFIPNRNAPLPLIVRMVLGGAAGAAAYAQAGKSPAIGGAIGAVAAYISTQVSFRLRAALSKKLPDLLAALVGDSAVVALGRTTLR